MKNKRIAFEVTKDFESPATKGKILKKGMRGEMRENLLKDHMKNIKILNRVKFNESEKKKLIDLTDKDK